MIIEEPQYHHMSRQHAALKYFDAVKTKSFKVLPKFRNIERFMFLRVILEKLASYNLLFDQSAEPSCRMQNKYLVIGGQAASTLSQPTPPMPSAIMYNSTLQDHATCSLTFTPFPLQFVNVKLCFTIGSVSRFSILSNRCRSRTVT